MFSLRARLVLPIDRPPIDGGVVTIVGDQIVAVGQTVTEGPIYDLGDVALLPGLVNAHVHLEYSLLAAPLGQAGMSFAAWIGAVVNYKRQQSGTAAAAITAGLHESLLHGVTSLGEIASPHWPAEPFADYAGQATLFLELLDLRSEQADERLDQARAHGDAPLFSTAAARFRPGLSPHAPYSVHPDLLAGAVNLARQTGASLAMHLAESREELELLQSGSGPFRDLLQTLGAWNPAAFATPRRPLDILRTLSAAPRSLVIHGNYLDEEEIAFAAQHANRMAVIYCPRTHAYFQHERHPLPRLLAAGATVALGTDGRGSNPDLNLLAEMQYVARHFPTITADSVLRMGTLDAARALGIDQRAGSLSPGKRADLVALALPSGTTRHSCSAQLLSQTSGDPWVMCGGQIVATGRSAITGLPN